jgi:uncharacterized protein (TIGR01777 family)
MTEISAVSVGVVESAARTRRIVLAGGSGQIGILLARKFHAVGNEVTVIARRSLVAPWKTALWDAVSLGGWLRTLDGADVVINLAGRSVDCRYNARHKVEILESRVRTTKLIGEAIKSVATPPTVWINASTATIYRHASDRAMDEDSGELGGTEAGVPQAWRFSTEVARVWEDAFFAAATPRIRKIALRSAMTLSPDTGGVFDALLRLVRIGLGGRFGTGRQYVSWIHERDFVGAVEFLIANEHISGAVNVSAPNPVVNTEFMTILREAWGTTVGLPSSKWMLEFGALFLRTETELILKSRRVVPGRLLRQGFTFEFPQWREAARDLVSSWRKQHRGGA